MNENAVMNQIWAAMITTLLVELLRRESRYEWSFSLLFAYLSHARLSYGNLQEIVNYPEPPKSTLLNLRKRALTVQEIQPFGE